MRNVLCREVMLEALRIRHSVCSPSLPGKGGSSPLSVSPEGKKTAVYDLQGRKLTAKYYCVCLTARSFCFELVLLERLPLIFVASPVSV